MSTRVRFAPSPTGRLHVGNVRTALMNALFAHKTGGTLILRIDDTDQERSELKYEHGIQEDLKWLGMEWQERFKQSDHFDAYDTAAEKLKAAGLLYPAYETSEELDRQRKLQRVQGKPPVYNRAALELTEEQVAAYEREGRKPHWRYKLSGDPVTWVDAVRGEQSIDTSSLSDPVLIREDGTYLYTLPSVVDDIRERISHVIRGEDHVTNSGAQIEIFQALGDHVPIMAHTPLLVGEDGSKLSKRLDSLSMHSLRDEGIEPLSLLSYLSAIGTSDEVELADSFDQLAHRFGFEKFGRAPARFDMGELWKLNADLMHAMPFENAKPYLEEMGVDAGEDFWTTIRANIEKIGDAASWSNVVYAEGRGMIAEDDAVFCKEAADCLPDMIDGETWSMWTKALKAQTGRKGRGLFMPLRLALTGRERGPGMDRMLTLLGAERAKARLRGEVG